MRSERYYDEDGNEVRFDGRRKHTSGNGPAYAMVIIMAACAVGFLAYLAPDFLKATATTPQDAPSGAVGRQAPPAAVRRTTSAPAGQAQGAAVQTRIDQYNQAQEQQFNAAVNAAPASLPLNSQGEPVIDQAQANQQQLSLSLAEQEGAAAVDAQLAAQRDAANAEALSRPPDVSKAEAEAMMGRDLCHVPRANPATCGQGLYKPTPVQ